MKIRDWEGIALIIGVGDIGTSLSDYLRTIAPKLDVIGCGRKKNSNNGLFLDLENDDSFYSFEKHVSSFKKPLRLVINTTGFLHSNLIKPEKSYRKLIELICLRISLSIQ